MPVSDVKPCKYCGEPIRFFRNSNTGKVMPADAYPVMHDGSPRWVIVADGNYVICTRLAVYGETVYLPHWLNKKCPNARVEEEDEAPPAAAPEAPPCAEPDCFSTFTDDE